MRKVLLTGAAVAFAALAMAGSADAAWRGGFYGPHFFFGPRIGFGLYAPLWVPPPPPVVYAPPPVVVQPGYVAPPAMAPAPAEPNPATWYYCNNPQGYYPYVRQCSQWMTVPANPNAPAQ